MLLNILWTWREIRRIGFYHQLRWWMVWTISLSCREFRSINEMLNFTCLNELIQRLASSASPMKQCLCILLFCKLKCNNHFVTVTLAPSPLVWMTITVSISCISRSSLSKKWCWAWVFLTVHCCCSDTLFAVTFCCIIKPYFTSTNTFWILEMFKDVLNWTLF